MNMVDPASKVNGQFCFNQDNQLHEPAQCWWDADDRMKTIIVQIYEIQDAKEAENLMEIGVDRIGSVIVSAVDWKKTGIRETVDLVGKSGRCSSLILLFNDPEVVFRALDYYQPHIVHFCEVLRHTNGVPEESCHRLLQLQSNIKDRYSQIGIMRSIPISTPDAETPFPYLETARLFEPVSDFFLTDTVLPGADLLAGNNQPVQGFVGITGKPCNWQSARRLVQASRIPVILAGGLSPANVADGIRQVTPAGVDSCTLTNTCDDQGNPIRFQKDFKKVAQFVKAVRQVQKEYG